MEKLFTVPFKLAADIVGQLLFKNSNGQVNISMVNLIPVPEPILDTNSNSNSNSNANTKANDIKIETETINIEAEEFRLVEDFFHNNEYNGDNTT